jgi:cytochrome c2
VVGVVDDLAMPMTPRVLVLIAVLAGAVACSAPGDGDAAMANAIGDPERGRSMLRQYGCQSCHVIPGVAGANGLVGPPLGGVASRSYIAGVLPNTPENMERWIGDPKGVDSLTAMPNVGVTPDDARHITAYLYTLR